MSETEGDPPKNPGLPILGVLLVLVGSVSTPLGAQVPTLVSLGVDERLDGGEAGQRFGTSIDFAGDVDGDGDADLVIGAPASVSSSMPPGAGVAYVVDAATAAVVLALSGTSVGSMMGERVCGLGDVDGDGRDDVLVLRRGAVAVGVVELVSGATGAVLRQHQGTVGGRFGAALERLPDLDGDGVPEYAIGAPGASPPLGPVASGRVFVHSGASGTVLFDWAGSAAGEGLGEAVAAAGDTDGDGVADVLIGGGGDQTFDLTGQVELRSGASGSLLWRLDAPAPGDAFGRVLAGVGDFDGDGSPDLCVGAPGTGFGPGASAGRLEVRSAPSGALITTFTAASLPGAPRDPGAAACGLGDVDQDGFADLAVCFVARAGGPDEVRVAHGPAGDLGRRLEVGGLGCGSVDRLAGGRDLDGDGVGELLTADPLGANTPGGAGSVTVHHVLAPDPCAGGSVVLPGGGPLDLLGVATTTAFDTGGPGRTVDLSLVEPWVGIVVARPPLASGPVPYLLFAAVGSEVFSAAPPLVGGLAPLCFTPQLAGTPPGAPGFVLADPAGLLPATLPSVPATAPVPGSVVAGFAPPPVRFTLVLQAVIVDPGAPALGASVTNAVEVHFR